MLLPDLHTGFSRGRSDGLVFPSLRIFQFIVIHTVKGFGIVNEAEIDVFLKLSCFFDDSSDVVSLISGSSAFSKTSFKHLEIHGSCTTEAWLRDFSALFY